MNALFAHLLKLKKVYLIVFLLFITNITLVAQEFESDSTSLLTSVIWKAGKNAEVVYKFNTDGTFFSTASMPPPFESMILDSMGKWEWIRYDTFTMQTTQTITNGQFKDLNPEPYHKRVIRITRIDNRILQGITYNILVNEDSEYAFQFDWKVKDQ
jgi:hypothetical protein